MTARTRSRSRSRIVADVAVMETLERRRMMSESDADMSFGLAGDGFAGVGREFLASTDASVRMARASDGATYVVGDFKKPGHWTWLGVAKFDGFGDLDMTFGIGNGFVHTAMVASPFHTPGVERAIAVQSDGKVVVAAAAKVPGSRPDIFVDIIAVTRFNADGTVDAGFADNGTARMGLIGALPKQLQLHLGSDGKITVQGRAPRESATDLFLARFHGSGKPDNGLGVGGTPQVYRQMSSVGLYPEFAPDGKIIMAVGTPAGVRVSRLQPNGEADLSFGTNGSTEVAVGGAGMAGGDMDVAIQPGGKIVAGGWVGNGFISMVKLARLNLNGTIDPTFGTDGIATGPNVRVQTVSAGGDGTLVAFGPDGLLRFSENGGLDATFGGDGILTLNDIGSRYDNERPFAVSSAPAAPQLDGDGRIVLAGIKTTPNREANLAVGALRIGMDAVEYNPNRERLFIRGTDGASDEIVVEAGSGDDVVVRVNGVETVVSGGVVGIDARLGLGNNSFIASGVNAPMRVNGFNNDRIVTGGGFDTIYGHGGSDTITSGDGQDLIAGAPAALLFSGGPVSIDAGGGNDTAYGSTAGDEISGSAGNDTISAAAGDDRIHGGSGDDFIDAHNGNDDVYGADGADAIYGGKGNDTLRGNGNADTLDGGAGHDRLYGHASKDSLLGGDGNDLLYGGEANDRLFGGAGDDRILGEWDHDVLFGDAGNDVLTDRLGLNYFDGGVGDDHLISYGSVSPIVIDTVVGGDGADTAWHDEEDVLALDIETRHIST